MTLESVLRAYKRHHESLDFNEDEQRCEEKERRGTCNDLQEILVAERTVLS